MFRQGFNRCTYFCRLFVSLLALKFEWWELFGLLCSESLDDVDEFMHGPVLEVIKIVCLGTKLNKFLWIIACFDDILSEVVLFVLESKCLHFSITYSFINYIIRFGIQIRSASSSFLHSLK